MPRNPWEGEFQRRMASFEQPKRGSGRSVSIKVRVSSGCFHREHSPHAYRLLDDYFRTHPVDEARFQEHESGPEVLVWLAVTTAGISPAKSVIDLVTAIVKARSDGIERGDRPSAPLELVVRNMGSDGRVTQETVLRLSQGPIDSKLIEQSLNAVVTKLLAPEATTPPGPSTDVDPRDG
jgi:hypothetical protein